MEISKNTSPSLNTGAASPKATTWRVGQILQAVVIRQLSNQLTLLEIGQQQIQAETPKPLPLGLRMQVEVVSMAEKPILSVLNRQQPITQASVLNQAVKQALPQQTSLAPLLANLRLIGQTKNASLPVPAAIQTIVRNLLGKLPTRDKVSSSHGVKQAIKDSGGFLENKLQTAAQTQSPNPLKLPPAMNMENDVKGMLLRLMNAIQKQIVKETAPPRTSVSATPQLPSPTLPAHLSNSLPPPLKGLRPQAQGQAHATLSNITSTLGLLQELGRQTEGSIARTQLNQIASIPTTDQGATAWSLELPICNQESIDLFHLTIEEDNHHDSEDESTRQRWRVMIAVDMGELGPLHIKLQLEDEKISTTFWADKPDTSQLVSQHITELAQRYKNSGIESSELRCFQGTPPAGNAKGMPRVVLDVKV